MSQEMVVLIHECNILSLFWVTLHLLETEEFSLQFKFNPTFSQK